MGKFSIGGKNDCELCRAGKIGGNIELKYRAKAQTNLASIVAGTNTNNQVGATACQPCSPGSITDDNICVQCDKGKYAAFGALTCSACSGEGEYAAEKGLAACSTCPQYEIPSADKLSCDCMTSFERVDGTCTCKAGETLMGTSCSPCELGKWKNDSGVTR